MRWWISRCVNDVCMDVTGCGRGVFGVGMEVLACVGG